MKALLLIGVGVVLAFGLMVAGDKLSVSRVFGGNNNAYLSFLTNQWIGEISGVSPLAAMELQTPYGKKVLRENIQKDIDHWLMVSSSVKSVNISKTLDTDTYVLEFMDIDGNQVSLWLDGENRVRSITPY